MRHGTTVNASQLPLPRLYTVPLQQFVCDSVTLIAVHLIFFISCIMSGSRLLKPCSELAAVFKIFCCYELVASCVINNYSMLIRTSLRVPAVL